MDILVSGCSFTNQVHPADGGIWNRPKFDDLHPTWPDYLYKRGYNIFNIGVPTNSNTNIVRGLIYHSENMLKENKKFSIIAQFSTPSRHQIFISKKETISWIEFLPKALGGNNEEFDWNLTNFQHTDFSNHFWLLTGENFGREFANSFNKNLCQKWGKYFFSIEQQRLNTLERIYDLQEHCILNDIPYKIFFMNNNYLELDHFREDEKFKCMYNLVDWSNIWLYREKGGMAEWMKNKISDPDVRYKRSDPKDEHPSDYAHEKFVDDIILKWDMFKDA